MRAKTLMEAKVKFFQQVITKESVVKACYKKSVHDDKEDVKSKQRDIHEKFQGE